MRAQASLLTGVLLSAFCLAAAAADKAEAKRHFEAGKALMKVEEFGDAAAEFELSIRAYPTKNALFNLANCYKATKQYQQALNTYALLQRSFGNELAEEIRVKIDRDIEDIRSLMAWLDVSVSLPGARVAVDGVVVGTSPLEAPVVVGSGNREVEVAMDGYQTYQVTVSIRAGERLRQEIVLEELVSDSVDPSNGGGAPEAEEEAGLGPAPFIVAASLSAAFGVTTIVLDAKATEKYDDAKKANSQTLLDDAKGLQTGGRVTLGLTAAGVVATGVIFIITDFGNQGEKADETAMSTVVPLLSDQGAGVSIVGRF
jgi:tetratricopeptide (TPR) repeat protein